ncbi:MAG: hypothetical protein JRN52_05900 [Nitrososphaerota archaeon]|nr:hypothetical protein [Nitrososphaerota archaeon]
MALLVEGASSSADILKITGISASWNKEKHLLENRQLIDTEMVKSFTQNTIARKAELRLTRRGKLVAQVVLLISELIA